MNNRTVSSWQAGILMFILMFANKVLILPSLLFQQAGLLSFLIVLVSFLLEFVLIYLFFRLKKKFPTQNFFQIVKENLGKFWRAVVLFFSMLFFFGKSVLLYDVTFIFFSNSVYKDSNNTLFLIAFIPVVIYLSIVGLRAIGRTCQIFFPVIIFILCFTVLIGCLGFNEMSLIASESFASIARAFFRHLSAFGDSIFLFIFMDKFEIKKWSPFFLLWLVSALVVTFITLIFTLNFTYTSYMHPFALFDIVSQVQDFGNVGRLDIIAMVLLIILTYFQLSIYLSAFIECFKKLFKLNEIYAIIIFYLFFLIFISYLILNLEKAIVMGETLWVFYGAVGFVLFPLVVIFILSKRRRQGVKT